MKKERQEIMNTSEVLKIVDHTLLTQTATWEDIKTILDDGIKYETASACIPAAYVKQAAEYVEGKPLSQLMEEHPEKLEEYLQFFVKIQLEVLSKKVPLLSRIKDKFRRKLTEATNISNEVRYDLLQRLEGMKNHAKLCHGDFNPSNIIVKENGEYCILDWSHATQGNASADAARTFLLFSMKGQDEIANRYLEIFANASEIEKNKIQTWIPIVAATQMTKGKAEEQEFLSKWIDIVEYQ